MRCCCRKANLCNIFEVTMNYLKEFAGSTSMHGFSRIIFAKATPKRLAWIIVFSTAWILFTIQMSFVLRAYFEYPKKMTSEIVLGGVPFPAITMCNLGSLDFYTVYKLSQGIGDLELKCKVDEVETDLSKNNNSCADDPFIRAINKYYDIFENTTLDNETEELYRPKVFSRTSLAANIPKEMLVKNGFQKGEFIAKCTYRNQPCKLERIFDPYFFNCFTFTPPDITSAEKERPPLFEGVENGLSVMLLAGTRMLKQINNPDYKGMPGIYSKDSALSGAGGVRVVIHSPGTKPFPLTEGYDVAPSQMTSFGISPKRRIRIGQPYGTCNQEYPFLNPEEQKLVGPYRRMACEKVCIQDYVFKECNCNETTFPTKEELFKEEFYFTSSSSSPHNTSGNSSQGCGSGKECFRVNETISTIVENCRGTKEFRKCFNVHSAYKSHCDSAVLMELFKKIDCAENATNRIMGNSTLMSECGCHPACEDFLYDVSYSVSQWPSQGLDGDSVYGEIFEDINFVERFSSEDKKIMYQTYVANDSKRAMKDFAKLNVYVSDANVLQTVESPAMTRTQLISDIGGQLGIWIGVSVITLTEVLEMLISILIDCCRGKSDSPDKATDAGHGLDNLASEDS